MKWDVDKYIEYKLEDYRGLSTEWFNASDYREAEIFWSIRYGGLDTFTFKPQWFPVSLEEFKSTNLRRPMARSGPAADIPGIDFGLVLDDPMLNLKWVGLLRGGVWGIRGRRGFLLYPRVGYLGPGHLKFDGNWLLVIESSDEGGLPSLRYNRRTDESQIVPDD